MRVHYYDGYPNFGDQLNKQLWTPYFQPWLARAAADDITLLGVGTLLGERDYGPGRLLVCGAGFGYRADTAALRGGRVHVCFVRGPLSAQVLGLDDSYAVTDPAALVPKLFPAAPRGTRALLVPHWETAKNPLWRAACAMAGVDYADPSGDVAQVLQQISRARLVLAESLHAAICADAYRVPFIPVVTSPRVNAFKWHDWLSTLELRPRFERLPRLGCSDLARGLQAEPPLAAALERVLAERHVPWARLDPPAAAKSFEWLMTAARVSEAQRSRVLHTLLWRVGPRLDALSRRLHIKATRRALQTAAFALQRLAADPGYLSEDRRAQQLQAVLEERIHVARELLTRWSGA